MASSNLISVLMPVFNAAAYLDKAIESILSQTHKNIELIIVDDGSTDPTAHICEYHLNRDPRISLFRHAHSGIASSLNLALSRSSGNYIARMDADDISEPQRLELQLSYLLANPGLSLIGSQAVIIDDHDVVLGRVNKPVSHHLVTRLLKYQSPLIHPSLFATKASICSLGGYRDLIAEDLDLLIRAKQSGYLIGNCPEYLLRYRSRESSLTASKSSENLICTNALLSAARRSSGQSYLERTSMLSCGQLCSSNYLKHLFFVRLNMLRRANASRLSLRAVYYIASALVSILHIQLILLMRRSILVRILF